MKFLLLNFLLISSTLFSQSLEKIEKNENLIKYKNVEIISFYNKHKKTGWSKKISLKNVIDAKVRKSLTPAIISASAGMTIGECLSLMSTHEISEIPVIDQGKMVGSVRENKLMGKLLQDRESNGLPVSEIMEEPMPMLKAEEEIQSGIQKLKDYPAIAVEEFGRIVGVITRHDVIEYI